MSTLDNRRTIEVCFSPALFQFRHTRENYVVVIVDILRATTVICTAFGNGATEVVPVAEIEDTVKYREFGYKVAGEREGMIIKGADFGNSPFDFTKKNVNGEKIVITTTNGTRAIELSKACDTVVLGSFSNLSVLTDWLESQLKNIVILCSGWKNKFNLEDSIFAGALIENLLNKPSYKIRCDSALAASDLWKIAKSDVMGYIEKAAHRYRLKKLGFEDVLNYCFTKDTHAVVPVLYGGKFVNALRNK